MFNLAKEGVVGIGADGEFHRQAIFLGLNDTSNVGFVDGGKDVHLFLQVGRQDKQLGRLKLGSERLALLNFAFDDNAINGRTDFGVRQIRLGRIQRRLRLFDRRFGELELRFERHAFEVERVHLARRDKVFVLLTQRDRSLFVASCLLVQR